MRCVLTGVKIEFAIGVWERFKVQQGSLARA